MFACLLFQDEELVRKAEETFNDAWTTIKSDGWKVEKQIPEGDIVHSKFLRKNNKIFRITVKIINSFKFFRLDFSKFFFQATIEIPPKLLYDELNRNIENVPKWNPTLLECRTLKVRTT